MMHNRTSQLLAKSLLIVLLLTGSWVLRHSASRAETAQERKALKAAKSLHRKGGYPTYLPKGKPPPTPPRGCEGPGILSSGWGAGCASAAPWILLGIVLALLLSAVLPSLRRGRAASDDTIPTEAKSHTPEILGRTMMEDATIDDFLKVDDWEGAICFLLYQAMRKLGWQHKGQGKSQTAREIVFQVPPSATSAPPLYELLKTAERVRFGGETADRALFDDAKELLLRFQSTHQPTPSSPPDEVASPEPSVASGES